MHCRVVHTHIQVHLQTLLLKESDVEIIDSILETELRLIVGTQSLCHLRGLSGVVIEINCAECYKWSVRIRIYFADAMSFHYDILEKLRILDFKIKYVLIDSNF